MLNVRLSFSKTYRARYISHLDLVRCFSRAIGHSGIDVWYTEGFNSHIYMTFALPLSLGYESIYEIVDIRLTGEEIDGDLPNKLNAGLPHGIEVFDAAPPKQKVSEIAWARYVIELCDGELSTKEIASVCGAVLGRPELPILKKSKKGVESRVDIKPLIRSFDVTAGKKMCYINAVVAAGNERTLNPSSLLDLIFGELGRQPDHILVKRIQILNKNFKSFE